MSRRQFLKIGSAAVAALSGIGLVQTQEASPAGWHPEPGRYFLLRSDTETHCIYCGADTHGWMTTRCNDKDTPRGEHLPLVFSLADSWSSGDWRQVVLRPGLFPTGTRLWRMDDPPNAHGEVLA